MGDTWPLCIMGNSGGRIRWDCFYVIRMINSDGSDPMRLNQWDKGERRMSSLNPTGDRIIQIRLGVPNGPAIALMDTIGDMDCESSNLYIYPNYLQPR